MSAERRGALAAGAGIGACLAALVLTGRALPMPSDLHPSALASWAGAVGPATTTFTGLRAVAVVLLVWWALTGLAGVVARRARRPRLVAALDRLAPVFVRRLAEAVAGLGVVGASLAPAVGAGAAPPPAAAAVTMVDVGPAMIGLGPVDPSASPPTTAGPAPSAAPTTSTTTPSTTTSTSRLAPAPSPLPAPSPPTPTGAPAPASTGRTWVIAPGDTLWHVAEATAAVRLGRAPTAAEVVRALDELVALNLGRLAVPDDPGLVFPGQEFVLP